MSTSTHAPGQSRRGAQVWLLMVALTLSLAGCREEKEAAADLYEPAHVEEAGVSGVQQVTFTPEAAQRVDLKTETAIQSGPHIIVSYAAMIYDGEGVPWVYTAPKPLTFLRTQVVVDRIEGDRVLLTSGPPAGTAVVTVGATEVYGAELDIAGSH